MMKLLSYYSCKMYSCIQLTTKLYTNKVTFKQSCIYVLRHNIEIICISVKQKNKLYRSYVKLETNAAAE